MKYLSTLLLVVFCAIMTQAQTAAPVADETIYETVDKAASYPGGEGAWNLYINNTLKYPESAKGQKAEGTVVVSFVVEPNGKLSNWKIVESLDATLDEHTVYTIIKSGRWEPATLNGKKVRQRITLPVRYTM
jgi:TonB family protein